MASETYDIGDAPVLTINTYDIAGVAADPTGLTVTVDPPSGAAIIYTYLTSSELTRSTTGVYKLAHPVLTVAGRYEVKATGTGANAASEQSAFLVRATNITP